MQGTVAPSVQELLEVMQAADLGLYIEMYVWASEPVQMNVFYDIEFVEFMARLERVATIPFYASASQPGKA